MVGSQEFFVVLCIPEGLQMRHYISNLGKVEAISYKDWLLLDFEHLLAVRLHCNNPTKIKLVDVAPYQPCRERPCPIYSVNTLPDSWVSPFVHLFASTYINNVCK